MLGLRQEPIRIFLDLVEKRGRDVLLHIEDLRDESDAHLKVSLDAVVKEFRRYHDALAAGSALHHLQLLVLDSGCLQDLYRFLAIFIGGIGDPAVSVELLLL